MDLKPLTIHIGSPRGRSHDHHRADLVTVTEQISRPPLGRTQWHLTVVLPVGIEQGFGAVRLLQLGFSHWPFIAAGSRVDETFKYSTRHRDSSVIGALARERVPAFPGRFSWDKCAAARRRTSRLLLQQAHSPLGLAQLTRPGRRGAGFDPSLHVGLSQPLLQAHWIDSSPSRAILSRETPCSRDWSTLPTFSWN